jgi:hypothetical protein
MTAYGITVAYEGDGAALGATTVHFADHPSRDRAVMYGIVKEVIFRLEHHKAMPDPHPYGITSAAS